MYNKMVSKVKKEKGMVFGIFKVRNNIWQRDAVGIRVV